MNALITKMTSLGLWICLVLSLAAAPAGAADTPAPPFTLADDHGNSVSLPRRHEGVDIYLFWASWCPYCKALMPHLQSILIEYAGDVRIYALNIRDDGNPREFLDQQGFDFILLPDADPIMPLYGVKATPGLFLVDGRGNIRLNLYKLAGNDSPAYKTMDNRQKSARRAPWWAAEVRQTIDHILSQKRNPPRRPFIP